MNRSWSLGIMTIVAILVAMLATAGNGEAAEQGVDLQFTDPEGIKTYEAPESVLFNFTVEHTGTALTQWVTIRVLNESSDWTHRLDAETLRGPNHSTSNLRVLLSRGEVATCTVSLRPDTASAAQTYILVVRGEAEADTGVWDAIEVGVVVPPFVGLDLVVVLPPGGEYNVTPPGNVEVAFDLYNKGNDEDQFLLKAKTTMSDWGWSVSITEGADAIGWTPDLPGDPSGLEPHRVVVEVHVPEDVGPDLLGHVILEATSYSDPDISAGSGQVPVRALQIYEFGVAIIGPESLSGKPGEEFEFQFRVINRGNGQDTFSISPFFDEDQAPGFDSHASPDNVTLEAGENTTFSLVVESPFGAAQGPYTFAAEVHSSYSALNPLVRNVNVQIGQNHAFGLTTNDPTMTADPGDRLVYNVRVTNLGNGLDAVVLELSGSPALWLTYIQPSTFPLVPGEKADVEVIVIVPDILGGAARSSYPLTVWANSTKSDAKASLEIYVELTPLYRLEWMFGNTTMTSPAEPEAEEGSLRPNPTIDLFESSSTTLDLVLWNMGNTYDNVSIEAIDNDDRMAVHVVPWKAIVGAGQKLEVTVTIVVQINILPGEHRFWLSAMSQNLSVAERVQPVEVDVIPVYNSGDFADKHYGDPLDDDYTYRYTTDGVDGPVTSNSGETGKVPAIDIVSVTATLDMETSTVLVSLELKGLAVEMEGVTYVVHFVNGDHRLTGPLVDPRADHTEGEFTWSSHDTNNSIFWMSLTGEEMDSRVPVTTMEVEVLADKVYFHIGVLDLRNAGVEPGSNFRLYAYSHQVDGKEGEGADGRITYDTAGKGAASAPDPFSQEPDEGSPGLPIAAGAIIALVAVIALFMFRRWKTAQSATVDEFDPDNWVEYD